MTPLPGCPVCGADGRRPFCVSNGYTIVECVSCTHAYVEAMPSDADLEALYRDTGSADSFLGSGMANEVAAYLGTDDRRFFAFYRDRLAAVARARATPETRILDFGCSQGAFVSALLRRGYRRARGFDISPLLVAEGRERWDLDLSGGDFAAFVGDHIGAFDLVHAANVLEHVREPQKTLADFRRLVGPAGALVLSVPNARSLQVQLAGARSPVIDPPHHLQYYGPRSFARLVVAAGFEVREVATEFWQPDSDLYLHKKGLPLWMCRGIRRVMAVPGLAINAARRGGIITVLAA